MSSRPHTCFLNAPEVMPYEGDCVYLYETYGHFSHVSAFYTPAMWIQFSHLELEYYEAFAEPGFFERQREHEAVWHGNGHAP